MRTGRSERGEDLLVEIEVVQRGHREQHQPHDCENEVDEADDAAEHEQAAAHRSTDEPLAHGRIKAGKAPHDRRAAHPPLLTPPRTRGSAKA